MDGVTWGLNLRKKNFGRNILLSGGHPVSVSAYIATARRLHWRLLDTWRRKLKLQIGKSDKPRFYPLAVAGPHQTACLQKGGNFLRLLLEGNRFIIEIDDEFSPSTLQRLILVLEQI
jgi:hypothetical protein